MKKLLVLCSLLALASAGFAQTSQPSAKVTAKTANFTLLPKTTGTGAFQTVLENTIKTANSKDLFITAAFEIGLFTSTTVNSKNMVSDTSVGSAEVAVRVLLDGREVEPGVVIYGRRTQTLSATLEGAIGACLVTTTNLDGTFSTTVDLACVAPEVITLILDSTTASSFSFVAGDVQQGVHTIQVQARIGTIGSAQQGNYAALGVVGKGVFTCESVRLIKDANVPLDVP